MISKYINYRVKCLQRLLVQLTVWIKSNLKNERENCRMSNQLEEQQYIVKCYKVQCRF